jgi:hypothetical protein
MLIEAAESDRLTAQNHLIKQQPILNQNAQKYRNYNQFGEKATRWNLSEPIETIFANLTD